MTAKIPISVYYVFEDASGLVPVLTMQEPIPMISDLLVGTDESKYIVTSRMIRTAPESDGSVHTKVMVLVKQIGPQKGEFMKGLF